LSAFSFDNEALPSLARVRAASQAAPDRRRDADGAKAAASAAAAIRSHQQAAGFWLTSHTTTPRFEAVHKEMNTYLTSIMIDLLDPIAESAGLADSLARARRHLKDQIEPTGLVRYHGRPDGPTIPSLGCVITPDSDDTALVWRIAPSSQPNLLSRAMATLRQYRTDNGLYRTWLAPGAEYRCIDPGSDPNPTDVCIQMHVYQFLAKADPPAARELCSALGRSIAEDRNWVYYAAAPLVPLLREADLRQAGCPLNVPESRIAAAAPGQENWLAAARLLNDLRTPKGPKPSAKGVEMLLRGFAADDFSSVRRAPPLLYHNDFTGKTSRFYWSEDFGYALWLRLYVENTRLSRSKA
jgi:hypothetical protein